MCILAAQVGIDKDRCIWREGKNPNRARERDSETERDE